MSYEKVKAISLNEKRNEIFITSASNNVFPITYSKWEYLKNKDISFEEKLGKLLVGINSGNYHLNDSMYKWNYAINMANKELEIENCYSGIKESGASLYDLTIMKYQIYTIGKKMNDKDIVISENDLTSDYVLDYTFSDGTKQYYKKSEYDLEEEKTRKIKANYTNIFLKYFNERHSGNYYLYSNTYGYVKQKGTSGSFYYSNYSFNEKLDYYKAYCLSKIIGRDIEIREV